MTAIIDSLRSLYSPPEWAVFEQVRSSTGVSDSLRSADAIAACLYPSRGLGLHLFEVKRSRSDFLRELKQPGKAREIGIYCTKWWFVVPSPWKHIVLSLSEIPSGWGLLEVGTGKPVTVVEAAERAADPMPESFVQSLLRSAANAGEAMLSGESGAPMVSITRPGLSRSHVGLACGHVAPRPLEKKMPRSIPCSSCGEGRPSDREVVEAAIEDAEDKDLARYGALIDARLGRGTGT